MIGIYKITNKINNKSYIGQSTNIQRRINEHRWANENSRIPFHKAIDKYGWDNFQVEILEECNLEDLNERESYWIQFYNSYGEGYNMNPGGGSASSGEYNGRARLTTEDIIEIREAYRDKKRRREVYEEYSDKISFNSFASIWDGRTWSHIMPEVYTKELKEYYSKQTSIGELSTQAILTDDEVNIIRKRYEKETARDIWLDYQDRIGYQTLQQILWGRYYKHLPIYKKKEKKWIVL